MTPINLASCVRYLKGIGPQKAKLLKRAGIQNVEDLLYYFPRRYEDRSRCISIAHLRAGDTATVRAEVLSRQARRSFRRRGFDIFEVVVGDETGRIFCVWFNQPYLRNYFKVGARVVLHGKVELYRDRIQMSSPEFEFIEEGDPGVDFDRIVPVYLLPQGFSQRVFRKMVKTVLDKCLPQVTEVLPFDIRQRHRLLNLAKSLRHIHFPENEETRLLSYQRLAFEEFFLYQMPLILRKLKRREKQGIAFKIDEALMERFIRSLPFDLTEDQKEVFSEIKADMSASRPMQRLLQGDVGSGKTVVATLAALIAAGSGYQAAFMAPTEILAGQHYEKIRGQIEFSHKVARSQGRKEKIKTSLLTSSLDEKEKKEVLEKVKKGEVDILIGTHALIQEGVEFKKLGLIVIDEQHKFGVSQRALLPRKGVNPDVLIMTATPIPRTLSLTLFGDLDISMIREMPLGPKKIKTVRYSSGQKVEAYDFLKNEIDKGRQAYVVYPVIEDNPALALASAKGMFQEFTHKILKNYKVGLIHGRVSHEEQDRIMRDFKEGKIQILVATTILEVGIDVPQATLLLIENAERFGLSQLHQIRGRIGRLGQEAYCLVVADPQTDEAKARLDVFTKTLDGFLIAEEDLKIRGPGEFFGERQSGLTELRIANPLTQMHLLKAAREEVVRLLGADPRLQMRQNQELKAQLHKRFPGFEKFIEVG